MAVKTNIMNKLTLEHLAPYLPYGLKIRTEYYNKTVIMEGLQGNNINVGLHYSEKGGIFDLLRINNTGNKPILRPLSDLSKKELSTTRWYYEYDNLVLLNVEEETALWETLAIHQELLKAHYDIFGLIKKGLAIDINTVDSHSVLL